MICKALFISGMSDVIFKGQLIVRFIHGEIQTPLSIAEPHRISEIPELGLLLITASEPEPEPNLLFQFLLNVSTGWPKK